MKLLKESLFWFCILSINLLAIIFLSIVFLGSPPGEESLEKHLFSPLISLWLYAIIMSGVASLLVCIIVALCRNSLNIKISIGRAFIIQFAFLMIVFSGFS